MTIAPNVNDIILLISGKISNDSVKQVPLHHHHHHHHHHPAFMEMGQFDPFQLQMSLQRLFLSPCSLVRAVCRHDESSYFVQYRFFYLFWYVSIYFAVPPTVFHCLSHESHFSSCNSGFVFCLHVQIFAPI